MTACPGCASAQPDEARFCSDCGARMGAPACVACGAQLLPGARFCNECGAAQGHPEAPAAAPTPRPVSSRRVTSVLFGDLVGFTALTEHRDNEETRDLLSRYFEECSQVIARYGGTIEKFIGDAVMAVWGVPTAHEDDAERAVRAGLELVAMASAMGQDLGVHELAMRVGIVTGEVAVTIGAEHQGMVAGDAVNTASRVQSVADAGQVWVDESTRLLTASAITYLDRGAHRLKGKTDAVPLWSVHAVVASVGGAQRADGLEAPLVARERELRLVKELFHGTEESRQPALLVMVGEPGVGKSRLAWEFDKYVDGLTTTVRWHRGRCVSYGEGLAFFALAEAIRPRLRALVPGDGSDTEETAEDQVRLVELGLEAYVPDEREREWLRPRMGSLLGIGSAGTFQREDLFAAWTVFLERVGAGRPLVLLIDDAHHADDGLLMFLEYLLSVATFPCFVVLLGRPALLEDHPALATNRRATVSHLDALNDADVATLLGGLVVGLPDEVRTALVARAEGVPLFAVETVRSLIDRDLVVPRGGQYVLADPESLDLDSIGAPASLHALIAARLDALDPQQRTLVERASVIGDSFSREDIAELCADLPDVDGLLAGLARLQILSQMSSRFSAEFGEYQFVQSVVRQVAYTTLSRRDRRALHLAVAAQTEAMDTAAGDLAPIIAQHYLNAVSALPTEPDVADLEARAIAQLERAAARARSLGALTDSANHLLLALDLAKDPATRARLDTAVAWALVDSGDRVRPQAHATAAVEAHDAAGDAVSAGLAAAALGIAMVAVGDNAGALALVEPRWEALEHTPGAEYAQLALGKVLSLTAARLGNDRRDVLDRRIQISERIGDREHLADSLNALAVSYSALSASETSIILLSAAADMARAEHFPVALARCLSNLTVEYNLVDLDKALAVGQEAVEVASRAGIAMWREYSEANLTLTRLASGRWDQLDAGPDVSSDGSMVSRVVAAGVAGFVCVARDEPFAEPWGADGAPESDDPSDSAWIAFAEAWHALSQGSLDRAQALATEASEVMYRLSLLSDDFVHMWPVAVELSRRTQDAATVARLLDVVDEAAGHLRVPLAVRAHRSRFAGLIARQSEPEAAEEALRKAIAGFTAWGSRHYRARAEGELGRWLESLGRGAEAGPLLESARVTLTDMRADTWLAELGLPVSAGEPLARTRGPST